MVWAKGRSLHGGLTVSRYASLGVVKTTQLVVAERLPAVEAPEPGEAVDRRARRSAA